MLTLEIQNAEGPGGLRILKLRGPLLLATLFELQNMARSIEYSCLIIDLAEVTYMDSAGLGTLLGVYASCHTHGRKFALARVSPRVMTLFQVAHVDSYLPQYDTVEAAQAQLSAKSESA